MTSRFFIAPFVLAAIAVACASPPDPNRATTVGFFQPDLVPGYTQFRDGKVSYFLERRCGTLDCHGQPGRPLRIYGRSGLRLPNQAGNRPNVGDTSEEEVASNYRSVVGLEPEVLNRVVAAGAPGAETPRSVADCSLSGEPQVPCLHHLLLVAKPLACNPLASHGCSGTPVGVEHKGGPVIAVNDDGYSCIQTWLQNNVDADRCTRAAQAY
jgi:hypothetical protein